MLSMRRNLPCARPPSQRGEPPNGTLYISPGARRGGRVVVRFINCLLAWQFLGKEARASHDGQPGRTPLTGGRHRHPAVRAFADRTPTANTEAVSRAHPYPVRHVRAVSLAVAHYRVARIHRQHGEPRQMTVATGTANGAPNAAGIALTLISPRSAP